MIAFGLSQLVPTVWLTEYDVTPVAVVTGVGGAASLLPSKPYH
ncbi:hypothetical protein [Larkinella sp. C7]|nr:hypothetical protein [Larkinella sp. C7]